MKKNQKKSRKRLVILLSTVIVLVLIGVGVIIKRSSAKDSDNSAKTTSTVPSAQSNFSSNDTTKSPGNTSQKDSVSGGITDTNGASATPLTASNATSSSNGEIVVFTPTKNSLLTNGSTVSGTSNLAKVSYRIIDTEVGVISSGSLNVVNGKFSGTIQFQTNAKDGQLDFFGTQSNGNEFDNISVPVSFK